jgi:hypothetical protein
MTTRAETRRRNERGLKISPCLKLSGPAKMGDRIRRSVAEALLFCVCES